MMKIVLLFEQIKAMAWAAAFVIPVVLLCRCLLARAPKKFSYYLWGIVALRLIFPVMLPSEFSLFHYTNRVEAEFTRWEREEETFYALENGLGETYKEPEEMTAGETMPEQTFTDTNFAEKTMQDSETLSSSGQFCMFASDGAVYIWLVGGATLLSYAVISYTLLKKKLRFATKLKDGIYESEAVQSPFVFGIVKPVIYLPYHLNETEMAYILKHEKYHIRRKDYLIKWFAFLLLAVYWFQPLVWAAYILMSRDMEMSCDEYVLGDENKTIHKEYCTLLLQFATEKHTYPVLPLSFGENSIRRRISHILHYKKKTIWSTVGAVSLLLLMAVFCLTDAKETLSGKGEMQSEANKIPKDNSTSEMAQTLYDARNPYIGNASANGKLIGKVLSFSKGTEGWRSTELQTTAEPYILTMHFDVQPDENQMWKNAILLLALIGNCGEVDYDYISEEGQTIRCYISTEDANANLGITDIKDYGTSPQKVEELLTLLVMDTGGPEKEPQYQNIIKQKETIYTREDFLKITELLGSLPDSYEEALQREDILCWETKQTESGNAYLWEVFYDRVRKKTPASLLMAQITTEGDVIYNYLSYDDEQFYYVNDFSRDEFLEDGTEYREKTYRYLVVEERQMKNGVFLEAMLTNNEGFTCGEFDEYLLSSAYTPEKERPDAVILFFEKIDSQEMEK